MPSDDAELIDRYLRHDDHAAFGQLVERHLPLVYHVALRRLHGDAHAAEDASQLVFSALAKKARTLRNRATLVGWLHLATHHATAQLMRSEMRRRRREQESQIADSSPNEAPLPWENLAPVIDEILTGLNEQDREAVLLRYFEQKSFAEVGAIQAVSTDAARMRVDRALEKMQPLLAKRGIVSTASAIGLALGSTSALAVPSGLTVTISQAAIAASQVASTSAVTALFMSASKLKFAALGLILTGGVVTIALQHRHNLQLREELDQSRRDEAAASSRVKSLEGQMGQSSSHPSPTGFAPTQAPLTTPAETARSDNSSAGTTGNKMVPIDSLGNQGRATPRAAFATQLWAARGGDIPLEAQLILLGPKARTAFDAALPQVPANIRAQYSTPEDLVAFALSGSPRPVSAMEVLGETSLDADDVLLHAAWQHEGSSEVVTSDVRFHHTADGWKLVVPPSLVNRALSYLSNQAVPAMGAATAGGH